MNVMNPTTVVNTENVIKSVIRVMDETTSQMYKIIGEIEEANNIVSNNEHSNPIYVMTEIELRELEELLESHIASLHIQLIFTFEFYGLQQLKDEYFEEYKAYKNRLKELKYYELAGVLDSPVWGMMSKYYKAIKCLLPLGNDEVINNSTPIEVRQITNYINNNNLFGGNGNQIKNSQGNVQSFIDNSNKWIENVSSQLESLNLDESQKKELRENIDESHMEIMDNDEEKIKSRLFKIKEILLNAGSNLIISSLLQTFPMNAYNIGS